MGGAWNTKEEEESTSAYEILIEKLQEMRPLKNICLSKDTA